MENMLKEEQKHHFDEESPGAGEIISSVMAHERAERPCGNTVTPHAIIGNHKICEYRALERDERREDIFSPITAVQQIVRTKP